MGSVPNKLKINMRMYKANNVDDYIANSDPRSHSILNELRKIIKSTVPKVEEKISWGIPFYRYQGAIGGYSVYKNHVSFGCGGGYLEEGVRKELETKGYKTGKKTIQIKFDQKVPVTEIKQLLKLQVEINRLEKQ